MYIAKMMEITARTPTVEARIVFVVWHESVAVIAETVEGYVEVGVEEV